MESLDVVLDVFQNADRVPVVRWLGAGVLRGVREGSTKARGLWSTSHLGNNALDNGQRASTVSLKHALNSRESRRIGWNWERPPTLELACSRMMVMSDWNVEKSALVLLLRWERGGQPLQPEKTNGEKTNGKKRENRDGEAVAELNWNCHVRESEANQKKNNLYRIQFNCQILDQPALASELLEN